MDIDKITSTEGMILESKTTNFSTYVSRFECPKRIIVISRSGDILGWNRDSKINTVGFSFWIGSDGTFTEKKYIIRL